MSISRYLSTSSQSSTSRFASRFQLLNFGRFYALVVVTSLTLSLFRVFQFKINSSDFVNHYFPYEPFGIEYCETNTYKTLHYFKYASEIIFKCKLFKVFQMFNTILINIFFFVANVIGDGFLIRFTNQNLARKRQLFTSEDSIAIKHALLLKEKANKLTLINGILYFVAHMPEFVVTLLLLIYANKISFLCFGLFSCNTILDIAQTFNLIFIAFQFFIFKWFDSNVNASYTNLLGRLFHKKKRNSNNVKSSHGSI